MPLMHNSWLRDRDHIARQRNTRTCLESTQEPCMLEWWLMRRLLILGIALMVFVSGLVPLSACALLSSGGAECAQAMSQSPCHQMHAHKEGAQLSGASDKSCCAISQAPLPEMQYKAAEVSLAATTIAATINTLVVTPSSSSTMLSVVGNPSPPSFQSLLCTFLI